MNSTIDARWSTNHPSSPDTGRADNSAFRNEPGYLVRRLHQIATSIFLDQCKALSVTPVQYAAMTAIGQHPGCDQRTIARLIAVDRTTINLVTTKLEERQWVMRSRSGKQVDLTLTDKGKVVVSELFEMSRTHADQLLAPLTSDQRDQFLMLLTRLVEGNNALSRVPVR